MCFLAGMLLCGPLLQCHHRVEPLLFLTVFSAAFALARVSSGQKQDHHMWGNALMFPFLLNLYREEIAFKIKMKERGESPNQPPSCSYVMIRCGAWVREKLSHYLLLVPRGPGYIRLYLRERRTQLEDDIVSAGCVVHGVSGHDQRHSVIREGKRTKSS